MDVWMGKNAPGTYVWLHPFNGSVAQNFKFNGDFIESHVGGGMWCGQRWLSANNKTVGKHLRIEAYTGNEEQTFYYDPVKKTIRVGNTKMYFVRGEAKSLRLGLDGD